MSKAKPVWLAYRFVRSPAFELPSIRDASRFLRCSPKCIRDCLQGFQASTHGAYVGATKEEAEMRREKGRSKDERLQRRLIERS